LNAVKLDPILMEYGSGSIVAMIVDSICGATSGVMSGVAST